MALRVLGSARRHAFFLVLLAGGVALRVATQLTYRPAILYYDSYFYLNNAWSLEPAPVRPLGYSLFIRPFLSAHDLAVLPLLNHLMALGVAVLIYLVLLRLGVWPWLAALASAPVLLDAYHLVIEQMIMSDTLFEALVVSGLAALVWRRPPGLVAAAGGGLLLAASTTVRVVGLPLILAGAVYVLLAGGPLRRRLLTTTVFVTAFAVPLLAYAGYNAQGRGEPELTSTGAPALYARIATFADCSGLSLPWYERQLCPKPGGIEPRKGSPIEAYFRSDRSPANQMNLPPGSTREDVLYDFSFRIIRHQPLDFVRAVGGDFLRGFTWQKTRRPGELPIERWRFQESYPDYAPRNALETVREYGGVGPDANAKLASLLRTYQLTVGYTPGPLLLSALVLGLAATTGLGRARWSGLRATCLLWATTGAGLVLTADVYQFTWRYQLPGLILLPAAGALGLTALLRRDTGGDVEVRY